MLSVPVQNRGAGTAVDQHDQGIAEAPHSSMHPGCPWSNVAKRQGVDLEGEDTLSFENFILSLL